MKVKCIKTQEVYWGYMFEQDKEYEILSIKERKIAVITDYETYYEKTTLLADSFKWILKGYKPENLHEVIPGYISTKEKDKLYTKNIKCKYARIKGEDNQTYEFLLMTNVEFIQKGAAIRPKGTDKGKPAFQYTNYIFEDYFIDLQTQRDDKLKELGL